MAGGKEDGEGRGGATRGGRHPPLEKKTRQVCATCGCRCLNSINPHAHAHPRQLGSGPSTEQEKRRRGKTLPPTPPPRGSEVAGCCRLVHRYHARLHGNGGGEEAVAERLRCAEEEVQRHRQRGNVSEAAGACRVLALTEADPRSPSYLRRPRTARKKTRPGPGPGR